MGVVLGQRRTRDSTHANFCQKGSSCVVFPTPFVERSPFPGSNRVFTKPKEVANFSEMGDFLMIFGFTKNVPQVEGKTLSEI
jgi:hypothetical protein